jgi:hypothetical protein
VGAPPAGIVERNVSSAPGCVMSKVGTRADVPPGASTTVR